MPKPSRTPLSTRIQILHYLRDHNPATRDDLQTILQTTHQNITYHLQVLETAHLIRRDTSQKIHYWTLTPQGKTFVGLSRFEQRLQYLIPATLTLILTLGWFFSPFFPPLFGPLFLGGALTALLITLLTLVLPRLIHKPLQ